MCEGCYAEYGSPTIRNEKTDAAAALIARVYEQNCVGGNLHVQLDDWNIEDEFFDEFTVHHESSDAALAVERQCFDLMKSMTLEERASALALYDGYLVTA